MVLVVVSMVVPVVVVLVVLVVVLRDVVVLGYVVVRATPHSYPHGIPPYNIHTLHDIYVVVVLVLPTYMIHGTLWL